MLVDLTAVRKERDQAHRRMGWTEDELTLRRKYGLDGPPGTFDATCAVAEAMSEPTRAGALDLLKKTRRESEAYLTTTSRRLDAIGWRTLAAEPEVANAFECADRTIAAARRILEDEDARNR